MEISLENLFVDIGLKELSKAKNRELCWNIIMKHFFNSFAKPLVSTRDTSL